MQRTGLSTQQLVLLLAHQEIQQQCRAGISIEAAPLSRPSGFKNQMIMQEEYFQYLCTWKDGMCLGRRDSIF